MKKKILITGGSGFIGTNLIEFYKNTYEILNIDIKKPRNKEQNIFWKEIDINNEDELFRAVFDFQPNFVFHMAARTDLDGLSLTDYLANTKGVENVVNVLSKINSVEKIIFASSRLVCEIGYNPKDEFDYKPSTIYGESKIIGEKIVRESKKLNKKWIIVRPTSLWGPWFDIPYKSFFDTINKKIYFHPKNKKIYKKFGYIENSVFILDILLLDSSLNTKTVYLSDFKMLEIKEWADIISKKFHGKGVKSLPYSILKIIALIGDLLKKIGYKTPPLTSFRLDNIMTNMDFNTIEVENIVGKLPFNLNEATTKTFNWYQKAKS